MNYSSTTIKNLQNALKDKKISSEDLVKESLDSIKQKDSEINAVVNLFDDALDQARKADEDIKKGASKSLTGIPILIKDNICVLNKEVTAASKILKGFKSPFDSTVVKKLKESGAIILGTTNLDEFAMGGSTETSAYGVTKNPVNLKKVSGGSSGGSVASVAAGYVPVAIGSDTGGSIRQPSSFCGCVGLKPTYGSVSRYGLIALASSLDCVGPIGKSVDDVEMVFNIIKGGCDKDSTVNIYKDGKKDLKKVIGVPRSLVEKADSETLECFDNTLKIFKERGYKVKELNLKLSVDAPSVYYIIQPAEASSNLAEYDGVRYGLHIEKDTLWDEYLATRNEGFGDEVARRIILGNYVLSVGYYDKYYRNAVRARDAIRKELLDNFEKVDVIATPTTLGGAFNIGAKSDPISMYSEDAFTTQANLAGIPAISVPMQTSDMPIGIQFMGSYNNEDILFKYGREVENAYGRRT